MPAEIGTHLVTARFGNPEARTVAGYEKTGGGYVTAVVRGDVAAVKAAVEAGARNASKVGEVVATHVIARPHTNIDIVLPLGRADEARAETGGN